jgi:hypothetical protein
VSRVIPIVASEISARRFRRDRIACSETWGPPDTLINPQVPVLSRWKLGGLGEIFDSVKRL